MFIYKAYSLKIFLLLVSCFSLAILYSPASDLGSFFSLDSDLLWNIRLPRVLTAGLAGGSIALAGALSQAIFRNALATPSVLGTEAGASLGLAICVLLSGAYVSTDTVFAATTTGAVFATLLAMGFGRGKQALVKILLGGFALNALLGAGSALITSILMEQGKGIELYHWLMGSFSARTWKHVGVVGPIAGLGIFFSVKLARSLDILSLGDESAETLGLSVQKLQLITMGLASLLVAACVSVGGALPFVGLVVPHFTRVSTGPYLKPLIVNSFLGGAALTIAADVVARTLRYPIEMNVGLLTTILGAPYFIAVLRRRTDL